MSSAPVAKKIPKKLLLHGDTRVDHYSWLEEKNSKFVLEHLALENKYSQACLAPHEALVEQVYQETINRIPAQDNSVPYYEEGYYYYVKYDESEYPLYCRKRGTLVAEEEVFLDVNELAQNSKYCRIGSWAIDSTNHLLAYTLDLRGDRVYDLVIKDLQTQSVIKRLTSVASSLAWAEGQPVIYYSKYDRTLRPYQIWRHSLIDESADKVVYQENDATFDCYIHKSKSKQYLFISASQTVSSEYWFAPADDLDPQWSLFYPRERGHEYEVEHANGHFYIKSNWQAENFRILTCTENEHADKSLWQELIAPGEHSLLEDFDVFQEHLALNYYEDAVSTIKIFYLRTGHLQTIPFTEDCYCAYLGANPVLMTTKIRLHYTSFTTPYQTLEYDTESKEITLLKQQSVIGNFDSTVYRTQRLYATSEDGTQIPISVIYRPDRQEVHKPVLLYGYGAYGSTIHPSFSIGRLSLLDRGFSYAIAHVRGSQACGRKWYNTGRMLQKKNSFLDYIACAQHLRQQNFATSVYAMGGSAGGLLVGAALNLAPTLFDGVVAFVPFVDTLTTMLRPELPLTTGEYDEWGNPETKIYYDYIKSYSPYDNITSAPYPSTLVLTGLHDSQVGYWEPAKWVAKLREHTTQDNPILLKVEMDVGHQGLSGRYQSHREYAIAYAFLLACERDLQCRRDALAL